MSQRKTTAPPTPKHSRSSLSSRKGLIATEKTKKQSAKKRTALDNRFHRTIWRRSAAVSFPRFGNRASRHRATLRGCEEIQSGPRWWSLRGEIKERGGGDVLTSLTTSDGEIAPQPPPARRVAGNAGRSGFF